MQDSASTLHPGDSLPEAITIAKALSDPSRVRILLALSEHELCVCQLSHLLGIAPSTASRHVAILSRASLVAGRRAGRWSFFTRAGSEATPISRAALDWLDASTAGSPQAEADRLRLAEIVRIPPEELCRS